MISNLKIRTLSALILISSFSAFAQIEVHHEPLHHPVLTNQFARVLDVVAQPGDTSLLHQHSSNYCYITIQGGQIWLQEPGSEGRNLNLNTGFIGGYYENPDKALVHRFANCSPNTIRLIAVENLSSMGNPLDTIVQKIGKEETLINNSFFILTKITIASKAATTIHTKRPAVIINLESKPLQLKQTGIPLKQWAWLDPNKKATIVNTDDDNATIVLVQLKNGKTNSRK